MIHAATDPRLSAGEGADGADTRGLVGYGSRGLNLVRGYGAEVEDDAQRRYLDCTSMYGVLPLGHAHPEMLHTLREQSGRLSNCFASFGNEQRDALIHELGAVFAPAFAGPGDALEPPRFFFCNSGTEAIEAALKLARASTGRRKLIATSRGFHGRTLGATSITHKAAYRQPFAPLLPDVSHVHYGKIKALAEAIDEQTAAVILEPVQGEGGVYCAPAGYLHAVSELCRAYGVLLILDEVQTGFGRCGSLLAGSSDGAISDIVCLAKGIANGFPMGAIAVGSRVNTWPAGSHGSTFGGNPLACALARTCLRTLQEHAIPQSVAIAAPAWHADLASASPERIREVRGRGYMIGIQLREEVAPIQAAMQERGILVLSAGRQVLRLLPPLILNASQRDRVTETLAEVLR
jgi:[amino-group carrier protein]-gamma-(L-lysyl/L-ornithyl)-L-glutamate aminotransferase